MPEGYCQTRKKQLRVKRSHGGELSHSAQVSAAGTAAICRH